MTGVPVVLRILAFLICWGGVLAGMFAPPSTLSSLSGLNDKGLHFLALFAMSVTARGAMPGMDQRLLWPGMLSLAVFLEFAQSWLQPARQFSGYDIFANLGGVVAAAVLGVGLSLWFRHCAD